MNVKHLCFLPISYVILPSGARQIILESDQVKTLTSNWYINRLANGRQRFLDKSMERVKMFTWKKLETECIMMGPNYASQISPYTT
jgi:hypothetical protein